MPHFIALGCLEVCEKFSVGGVGWVGGISTPTTVSNQLKLGQVDVELGCDNSDVYSKSHISTKTKNCMVPKGCTKLRDIILKCYSDVFNDKLTQHDKI